MGCGQKRITGWYVCEQEQHQFHSPVTSVYFLHVGTCQWKKPFIFYCCFSHHSFPLCFGARLRKTLRLCVCVYIRPRTSSPQKPQRESLIARRTPDWQAYRTPTLGYATHMTLHTCTCFSTHVGCTFMGKEIHHRGHIKMPRGSAALTLVLNLFFFFTASPIVAVKRIQLIPRSNINCRT